jgi:hypothetical protein
VQLVLELFEDIAVPRTQKLFVCCMEQCWQASSFAYNQPQFQKKKQMWPKGDGKIFSHKKDLGQGARILTDFLSLDFIHINLTFKHLNLKTIIAPLIDPH